MPIKIPIKIKKIIDFRGGGETKKKFLFYKNHLNLKRFPFK